MFDFGAIFTAAGLLKLLQIVIGDLTMAGDNVVIMATIASRLPPGQRRRVLMMGVSLALIFLITFAVIATQLLKITGLMFAGGLLLLWVAYNMYRELQPARRLATPAVSDDDEPEVIDSGFLKAVIQITVADLSMSLDNVLLVASIARENPALLFVGLSFSVLLMGFAANYVAGLMQRHQWLSWIGLVVILYVAASMIYEGWLGGEHVRGLQAIFIS